MNTRKLWYMVAIAVLVAAASAVPAKADTVLYDNGPINGNVQAYTINFGFSVSDSFTFSNPVFGFSSATVGLWVFAGDTPLTVDWSIGTTFFGSNIASGTSGLANTFDFTNGFGYDIYSSTFSLNGPTPLPGTYYLTLQNATSAEGNPVFWDQNSGPSQAMDSSLGSVPSETFLITAGSDAAGSPEPASFLLLGTGLLGLAGGIRKRMKA
jgi:hypothetical protein